MARSPTTNTAPTSNNKRGNKLGKGRGTARLVPLSPKMIMITPAVSRPVIKPPVMANRIDPSHSAVPASNNAKIRFSQTIHGPGFGNALISPGASIISIHGVARPIPSAIKIPNNSAIDPVNATPTATPTNGAEQGVAIIVANTPVKKSPAARRRGDAAPPKPPVKRCAKAGTGNTNRSSMASTNTPNNSIITLRNKGLWN